MASALLLHRGGSVFGIWCFLSFYVDAENLEYHQDNVRAKDNLLVTTFCRVLVLIY